MKSFSIYICLLAYICIVTATTFTPSQITLPSSLKSALVSTATEAVPTQMFSEPSRFAMKHSTIQSEQEHHELYNELDNEFAHENVKKPQLVKGFVYYDATSKSYKYSTRLHGNYYSGTGCGLSDDPTDGSRIPTSSCSGLIAWGIFNGTIATIGHDQLSVETSARFIDSHQAYAAGFLEASMTAERMWEIIYSIVRSHKRSQKFRTFLELQDIYVRKYAKLIGGVDTAPPFNPSAQKKYDGLGKPKKSPLDGNPHITEKIYWYHVGLAINQLDGMLAGYNRVQPANKQITLIDLWSINDDGDLLDIERAVGDGIRGMPSFMTVKDMSRQQLLEMLAIRGHCSAMVKWTGNDLMVGHATWSDYMELLRMYKHMKLNFRHTSVKSRSSSYSSYAAMVWSSDDYYVLDTNMVVLETTLNILDESLYKHVDPQRGIMAWIRNLIANRVSTDGEQWVTLFSKYNSGTYNNQWMVVDYNKFVPGATTLQPGTLWVLEQIPGYVESRDVTTLLQKDTYWGSYNLPVFSEINKRSMFQHYADVHGEILKYKRSPRGKIMAREQKSIKDMNGMKRMLRYNKYQNDPESKGCPGDTIAARHDLKSLGYKHCDVNRRLNGATDAKITSVEMVKKQQSWIVTGPTTQDQKPFDWRHYRKQLHKKPAALPNRYNFDWNVMTPVTMNLPKPTKKSYF